MVEAEDGSARHLAAARRDAVLLALAERGAIRVTEFAEELGVTAVTVRRDVADLARSGMLRRVHGGAVALGAGPGAAALTRAHGTADRAAAVGVLVPSLSFYWPGVVHGAEEEASALGFRLVLRESTYDATDETGDLARLVDAGAAGLLLAPTMHGIGGERFREWLLQAEVPTVLLERTAVVGSDHRAVESVVTDHVAGATSAVHHLASLGHRRLGVALSSGSPHVGQIRAGWFQACADLGLETPVEVELPDRSAPDFTPVLDALVEAVAASGTTALLIHSDPEAIRFVQRAEEAGVGVPEDLAVVSYDDEVAALATPALTAVRPPRRTIGRTAVALLAARLADPGRPVHRVQVSPTLYVRASTATPA